jgi:hypothetical protein
MQKRSSAPCRINWHLPKREIDPILYSTYDNNKGEKPMENEMKQNYNRLSLLMGLPGLGLQFFGNLQGSDSMLIGGSILFIIGLAFYAKAKGRSPWWALAGFLSIFGLIILALLRDDS